MTDHSEDDEDAMEVEAIVADEEFDDDDDEELVAVAPVEVVAAPVDDDDDEDDDLEAEAVVVTAAVLPEEDDADDEMEEEVASPVAVAAVKAPPKKAPPAASKKSTPPKKKAKSASSSDKKAPSSTPAKKKKKKAAAGSNAGVSEVWPVHPVRLARATEARRLLEDAVPTLPAVLQETIVRSFGRLVVPKRGANKAAAAAAAAGTASSTTPFGTTATLYPAGFSCDRYEFSPVHGRLLKLRCAILDAARVRKIQTERKTKNLWPDYTHGPIFRILWGLGIDEDLSADEMEYPFDPQVHAQALGGPPRPKTAVSHIEPMAGMRVQVRFDKNTYYGGTITRTSPHPPKKKSKMANISIRYDDGSTEVATYPDPDIRLAMPGLEQEVDRHGNIELTELNGKPVTAVLGKTPLEAWGKVLMKLGMIDELMHADGLKTLETTRKDGLKEAKDKLEGGGATNSSSKSKKKEPEGGRASLSTTASAMDEDETNEDEQPSKAEGSVVEAEEAPRDPPSEKEKHLLRMVEVLEEELAETEADDEEAASALADARIALQGGPMLCNPFQNKSLLQTWMTLVVRKEKIRMGSTGNKRKIVSAVDLLERNDTFFNQEVEESIEGLPGSEYCSPYVFLADRSGGATATNRAWIHEAQLKHEKEAVRRSKLAKEAEAKDNIQRERTRKRKLQQDDRDEKKKQKLEEEEGKKMARIEERLARLRVQVEERLFKEGSFQREKVVSALARNLGKDFQRRRRHAETVAAQFVTESKPERPVPPEEDCLGLLLSDSTKTFSEDAVRVWDFVSTFGNFFVERGYMSEVPTLDSLQTAVGCLQDDSSRTSAREEAMTALRDLAIALCKPLAISLTRVLFASLIALNPVLQKEFGAAFFNEICSGNAKEEETALADKADVLLPVDNMTWQEIARLTFVSDALGELGMQRHEVAHLLRGYRSAGHPNSKEALRLRKAEGFSVSLVQQELSKERMDNAERGTRVRLRTPCSPLQDARDYRFFLHVAHSLPDLEVAEVRDNLKRSVQTFKESGVLDGEGKSSVVGEIDGLLSQLKEISHTDQPTKPETKILKKVRRLLRNLVARVAVPEVPMSNGHTIWPWKQEKDVFGLSRERVGLVSTLLLSKDEYKRCVTERERYMEEALRIKEEAEGGGANEDDDDDDDDDEEMEQSAEVVTNGDGSAAPVSSEGDAADDKQVAVLHKIGKETPYDEYCADIPEAPELIRRCLAVLRTLALTNAAEPFHYPVDPQLFPNYYDSVLRPMCLSEAGSKLQKAAKLSMDTDDSEELVEKTVVQFGRDIRLIGQNCIAYANAGPMVIAAGTELLMIFNRLFLDWVLSPDHLMPPLEDLDDEKCIDSHASDDNSTVLLCDGCEGKYNIARLKPPLKEIPKGDWYCPRCITGRWWGDLDPRVGKAVILSTPTKGEAKFTIEKCVFRFSGDPGSCASLLYPARCPDGEVKTLSLEEVDRLLAAMGDPVAPIQCLEAVAECPGYGFGVDHGLRQELVPVLVNPALSEQAAQASLTSSVFRDTVAAAATLLLVEPKDMSASEWLRLLALLVMKCSSSEVMQNVISKMETDANESMAPRLEKLSKVTDMTEILPVILPAMDAKPDHDVVEDVSTPATTKSSEGSQTQHVPEAVPEEEGVMVVDAGNVEVVEEMVTDATPPPIASSGDDIPVEAASAAVEVPIRDPRAEAAAAKAKRQKIIEDSFAAHTIKSQLKPALASFEIDNVSFLVDSSLSPASPGLDFASLRCRRMACHFCGLSDSALGLPLVRVPDATEWSELNPFAAGGRRTHLVAEVPPSSDSITGQEKRLVGLTVRVDGELFSAPEEVFTVSEDGDVGMTDFPPRSEQGFQADLKYRNESGRPFVTGSLSAHESCALAAHKARKEQMVQKYKDRQAELIEQEAGATCGRCLEIGRDGQNRSYWKFQGDSKSLFVSNDVAGDVKWYRFTGSEGVASVLVALRKDPLVKDLEDHFPDARRLVKDGTWTDLLMRRQFPRVAAILDSDEGLDDDGIVDNVITVEGGFDPYDEGEDVLVESSSGEALWDAVIISVSRKQDPKKKGSKFIDAYEVQYTGWSSRFVEWVSPNRVVEPNEHNRALQAELSEELAASRCGLPPALNSLRAKDFLTIRDRARGSLVLPDFGSVATKGKAKSDERRLSMMKASLLAIEAAVPVGGIHNTSTGSWRPEYARQWRRMVKEAEGPAALMRLVIYLEDMVSDGWKKESVGHLLSCLPHRWKAIGEATTSGIAIRIAVLDRTVKYATIDRKRYSKKKRR